MIKTTPTKILVLAINFLLMIISVFWFKNRELAKIISDVETQTNISSADENLLNSQKQIAQDRERKLRDLNTSPSQTTQLKKTTTTTTTTPAPKSSTTTKTS